MIRRDRQLLARLSAANRTLGVVNNNMGEVGLCLIALQSDGRLNADSLRALGIRLMSLTRELSELAADMLTRADELDRTVDADT